MMQHVSPAPALSMMATQSVPPPPYQESPQVSAHKAWEQNLLTGNPFQLAIQITISYVFTDSYVMKGLAMLDIGKKKLFQ